MPATLQELQEKELWEIKLKVLEKNMAYLSQNLMTSDHYCYLRSKSILTTDDQERIENCKTRREKAAMLIDVLQTKGPNAFDELCNSIRANRTQTFLLEQLHKDLEQEIIRKQCRIQPSIELRDRSDQLPTPSQHLAQLQQSFSHSSSSSA